MNRALPHLAFALSSLLVFAAACGDDASNNTTSTTGTGTGAATGTGGAGGSGAGGGTTTSSGTGGMPMECEGPGFPGDPAEVAITSVEATVVDLGTPPMPVANVLTFLCGTDICSNPQETESDGHVIINAPAPGTMVQPAFKYGDGLEYGKFAVPAPDAVTVLPAAAIARLPPLAEGQTLAPGTTVTSGDVTLTIPAETTIEIDYLVYDEIEKEGFRTTTISDPTAVIAIDPTLNLEIAYAVAPVETLFCPAVMVTVPNTLNWAPEADVEFFIHGVDVGRHWAPYAGWAKMSDGKVSADGLTVSTSPEGGMSILSVFGIRLKPEP